MAVSATVCSRCQDPSGLGFRAGGLGFTVWGLGFRVGGLRFSALGARARGAHFIRSIMLLQAIEVMNVADSCSKPARCTDILVAAFVCRRFAKIGCQDVFWAASWLLTCLGPN